VARLPGQHQQRLDNGHSGADHGGELSAEKSQLLSRQPTGDPRTKRKDPAKILVGLQGDDEKALGAQRLNSLLFTFPLDQT
jgi:hypothetical protein